MVPHDEPMTFSNSTGMGAGAGMNGVRLSHNQQQRNLRSSGQLHFYVMGDAPYLDKELERFPLQVAALENRADFTVHVGDMKQRNLECPSGSYEQVASILKDSPSPTFIVPGDNDWYECADSEAAYDVWQDTLGLLDEHWTKKAYDVRHQPGRPEHFAFTFNDVHVIGLHVVHASFVTQPMLFNISDDTTAWFRNELPHIAAAKAVVIFAHTFPSHPKYNPFYKALENAVLTMPSTPFVYLQGEHHNFQVDNPFPWAGNFVRVIVDKGGRADPLEVVCDADAGTPFKFKRRPLSWVDPM